MSEAEVIKKVIFEAQPTKIFVAVEEVAALAVFQGQRKDRLDQWRGASD